MPIAINVDQPYSKSAWAKVINVEKLQMLSDYNPLGETAKAYGIFSSEMNASKRANILIDEEGKVEWVKVYETHKIPNFQEVLAEIT